MFIFIGLLPTLNEFKFFRHLKFLNNFNLGFFSGYIGYFVLGYLVDNYEFNNKEYKLIKISGILGLLISCLGTIFLSLRYKTFNSILFEYESFPVMLYSVFIFIFFKKFFKNIKYPEKKEKMIIKLSYLTFGIYLIHLLFINIFISYNHTIVNELLIYQPFTTTILFTIVVFILSAIYSIIISNIPLLNKYLI